MSSFIGKVGWEAEAPGPLLHVAAGSPPTRGLSSKVAGSGLPRHKRNSKVYVQTWLRDASATASSPKQVTVSALWHCDLQRMCKGTNTRGVVHAGAGGGH